MIEHVQPGQPVKASTVNGIIDSLNVESETLDVRQTSQGTLIDLPVDWDVRGERNDKIYSVAPCQREKGLSSRAYVSLNLGRSVGECLDSVVLHMEDGTRLHPLSAGVVYQNTTTSFEGNQPGAYLLSAGDFGWDAVLGSTGWLSTKMEWPYGEFQPDVKLDVWKTQDQKRYVAFSNVDELSVEKDQLSALLAANGAPANELSLLKLEQSFPLLKCQALEVDGEKVPTCPLVHNDGEIHVWNADEGEQPVMWKADLVCFGASDE